MTKQYVTLVLFFAVLLGFSQDISITKSPIFKDKKKNSNLSFSLENENGGLVTIRAYYGGFAGGLKGYYIQSFDANLEEIKALDYKVQNTSIRNAFLKGNKLHLIEIETLKKEKSIRIKVNSANLNTLEFNSKDLISFSEKDVKTYFGIAIFPFFITNGWQQADRNHMGIVRFSKNKKFFAINFDIKNKDQETHKIFVFNNNFEKVYEKLITKNIKDYLFSYNDFEVDDRDGAVYFLGKSYEKGIKKTKKKGKANYHFELTKVNAETQHSISFKAPDRFIQSLYLLNNNDKLACVGFYGNSKESKYNGVCIYDLNPEDLQLNYEKFNPFSEEFLSDKYGDNKRKKKRKKNNGIKNIDLRSVYIMDNDEIVVNAEEFFTTTYTTTSSTGSIRTHTIYHFNDIITLRLKDNGDLKWARNINKAQTGFSNSSFTSLPVNDKGYFFINCSDKITTLKSGDLAFSQTSSKKSNLYVITIDENGKYSYKKLIDDKASKVYYKVNDGVTNTKNQTVYLLGERKKKGRIIKLKVN
jgi:hypothetical protein